MKIGIIGAWHLGEVYAVGFAELNHQVMINDKTEIIESLKKGIPLIEEPGLKELLNKHLNKNIIPASTIKETVQNSDIIIIAYDSPVDENDEVDTLPVIKAAADIAQHANKDIIVIISSQIPIGTSKKVENLLKESKYRIDVAYAPENLRLGSAVERFLNPDITVIGARKQEIANKCLEIFPGENKIFLKTESAEMFKHMMNSYFATQITWANEMSDLCEKVNANAVEIAKAMKNEKRIGKSAMILPGLGFGGGTLGRDIQVLKAIGKSTNTETRIIDAIIDNNNERNDVVIRKLEKHLGVLKNKKITILGLTYKSGTNTLRRSPSLEIINKLKKEKSIITAFDPSIKASTELPKDITLSQDINSAIKEADAVVIMTDWDSFRIIVDIATPKNIVIDTRNMLDPQSLKQKGITYEGIGIC